jgi:[ribosomal protein S5]-alanine N-acetyltransferase
MIKDIPEIETERLLLRLPQKEDVPAMVEHLNHWESVRYTATFQHPLLYDDASNRIKAIHRALENGSVIYSLIHKSDHQWLGFCGLTKIDKRADLGYILGRSFWGKGFMREAGTVLIGTTFRLQWFDIIVAETFAQNIASQNVLKALGFKKRRDILCRSSARGGEFPGYEFVLTREDWKKRP